MHGQDTNIYVLDEKIIYVTKIKTQPSCTESSSLKHEHTQISWPCCFLGENVNC